MASLWDTKNLILLSNQAKQQIPVLLLIIIITIPLFFLPTNAFFNSELVEIRLEVEEDIPSVSGSTITFNFHVMAVSILDKFQIGIPVQSPLLDLVPTLTQASIVDTTTTLMGLNQQFVLDEYRYLSPWRPEHVFIMDIVNPEQKTPVYLFTLKYSIQLDDITLFMSTDSFQVHAQNLLMIPLAGRLFARETGFLYTGRFITDGGIGWSNPSFPLVSSSFDQSSAFYYQRLYLFLMGLYSIVVVKRYRRGIYIPSKSELTELLYPEAEQK